MQAHIGTEARLPGPPRVSVLLPTWNRPALLRRAIASALAQTYTDFELIIIDDGSDEPTAAAARSFPDERIIYLRQSHGGAAAAENAGLAIARGAFISFLDDDDEWLPEKLRIQMEMFEQEPQETGVVYTARWRIKNGRKTYVAPPKVVKQNGDIHREILKRKVIVPLVCSVVRRQCFETVGNFDESLPTSNDYDLWIRISRRFCFQCIPRPLVIVHASQGSLSRDPIKVIEARKLVLRKHSNDFEKIGRDIATRFLWQIGSLLLLQGSLAEGRRYLLQAARRQPWRPLYPVSLVFSLAGAGVYRKCFYKPFNWVTHRLQSQPIRPGDLTRLRATASGRRAPE